MLNVGGLIERRCNWLGRGLAAFLMAVPSLFVQAQEFPARKNITLIVPYSAGATDTTARMFVPYFAEKLGQKVVVENVPGASGNLGYAAGMRAAPDGYTIVFAVQGLASNPALFGDAPYDPVKSFVPVTVVANLYQMLVASPSAPFNNVAELVALARKKPGDLTYAETGGSARFAMEVLIGMAGNMKLTNVTFKGGGESLNAVLGGHVNMLWDSVSQMGSHVQAGRLKPIAWAGAKRNKQFPNVPTVAETIPGYEYGGWFGLIAPQGTPRPVVDKLRTAAVAALQVQELQRRLEEGGNEVVGSTSEEFAALIQKEVVRYQQLTKQMGIAR